MAYNLLVVEDSLDWRTKLVGYLIEDGEEHNIFEAGDYETATQLLQKQPFDVVLIDIRLVDWDETNEQGMQLLRALDEISNVNATQSVVITGYGTKDTMREAFRDHQVVDFIEKQRFDPEEFKMIVHGAAQKAYRRREAIIENKFPGSTDE
jgi:DNA-binding NtrC family response regulator